MKKLCYILPEYNENIAEHFYHLYEFLERISEKLDIFLIIEKGNVGSRTSNIKRIYVQKFRFLPLRFLESFCIILKARFLGYRSFYTHYCYIGGVNAGIISRLFNGKSYYWHCEMIWEFKQKIFSKIGLNSSLKSSHFLVTGSEKMKQGYAKHYGLEKNRIKVMPNWINLRRFKVQVTDYQLRAPKNILFIHWLSERKGAHLLIPVIKELNTKYELQNTSYKIVGDGPLKEKILKEIKENKLEKYVNVLGKIPNKDLVKYYAMADIFILPSLQEGFPRVLLEAMAMGVPYVAFDVGAVREISPPTAQEFIVKPGDVKEFAKKIQILLSSKEIYDRFRKEELEKVKEYSLDRALNKFIKLFS